MSIVKGTEVSTPTQPGYYWYRDQPLQAWRPVEVVRIKGGLDVRIGDHEQCALRLAGGVWGPKIEPPKEGT